MKKRNDIEAGLEGLMRKPKPSLFDYLVAFGAFCMGLFMTAMVIATLVKWVIWAGNGWLW